MGFHAYDLRLRYDLLAGKLAELGVPRDWSPLIAEGMFDRLCRWCWEHQTDLLGNSSEVAGIVGWKGKPHLLANALRDCGLIWRSQATYYVVGVAQQAPEYAARRWQRANRTTWDAAMRRSDYVESIEPNRRNDERETAPEPEPEPTTLPEPMPVVDTLFPEEAKEAPNDGVAGYKEIIAYWFERYAAKYGSSYAFRAVDGANLKRLLKKLGIACLRGAIDNYLACTDPFYLGHEITGLAGKINRWTKDAPGRRPHEPRYGGAGDALPTAKPAAAGGGAAGAGRSGAARAAEASEGVDRELWG